MMKGSTLILFLSLSLFWSCENADDVDKSQVHEEINSRRIVRIQEGELISIAEKIGDKIADKLHELISTHTEINLTEEKPDNAISSCDFKNFAYSDSVQKVFQANIKRVGAKTEDLKTVLSNEEFALLDAYLYNKENNIAMHSNVQVLQNNQILYTAPIVFNNDNCLKCHGGNSISVLGEKMEAVANGRKITGYDKDDLAGMWVINFNRSGLVKNKDTILKEK